MITHLHILKNGTLLTIEARLKFFTLQCQGAFSTFTVVTCPDISLAMATPANASRIETIRRSDIVPFICSPRLITICDAQSEGYIKNLSDDMTFVEASMSAAVPTNIQGLFAGLFGPGDDPVHEADHEDGGYEVIDRLRLFVA